MVFARRVMGPDLPYWALLSSPNARHVLGHPMGEEGPYSADRMLPGRWSGIVYGPGWSTAPFLFDVEPGRIASLELTAEAAGETEITLPAVQGPGNFSVEVQSVGASEDGGESKPWTQVRSWYFHGPTSATQSFHLPPGRWRWRTSCGIFSDPDRTQRGVPQASGEWTVVAGQRHALGEGPSVTGPR